MPKTIHWQNVRINANMNKQTKKIDEKTNKRQDD